LRVKKILTESQGNAILEFIVIFPLFMGIILGMINLAVFLNNDMVASLAARDAGQTVAVTANAGEARRIAMETMEMGGIGTQNYQVNVNPPSLRQTAVSAETSIITPVMIPGLGALLGGSAWDSSITIHKRTWLPVEWQYREEKDLYHYVWSGPCED